MIGRVKEPTYLLAKGDLGTLEARAHATCTKTTLSYLPETIYDGIEYEVVGRWAKAQAAPKFRKDDDLDTSKKYGCELTGRRSCQTGQAGAEAHMVEGSQPLARLPRVSWRTR